MTRTGRRRSGRQNHPSVLSQVIAGLVVGVAEGLCRESRRKEQVSQAGGHEGHRTPPQTLAEHHKRTQWAYWAVSLLGIWLLVSPATFSYSLQPAQPAGGREIWLSADARAWILSINDVICGFALVWLGWRSLTPNRPISLWTACVIGAWLNFAPVLFWAPRAVIYLNETLVGTLVIALTILIPGMPNMVAYMKMGPNKPPGWTFNPSSWPQRAIMIALGFAGWLVARHLGMYQLGYLDQPWEPFFGSGSRQVLTSKISQSLPVSDGSLGALAYTFEFLMGWMGGQSRWRTMPWMVTFFGILVIPLGLVHISLVISQPVVVGHWCTLCLLAAAVMLPMIPLEVDEVIAMAQFMIGARKRGESLWHVFWKGGTVEGEDDHRTPDIFEVTRRPLRVVRASVYGLTLPWNLCVSAALGVWMMAVPDVLGDRGLVADVDHLAGALVTVASVVAFGEPVRVVRWLNILFGLLIAGTPFIASGDTAAGWINDVIAGLAIIALSIRRGPISESFGEWDKWIR